MRLNQFVARATGLSRRAADKAIAQGRVSLNGNIARPGEQVLPGGNVTLDNQSIFLPTLLTTIILNKPAGYVCSRQGQGSKTIYDLLPPKMHNLKPVGRLDKESSGLLLLTNDGQLAYELTHPKYAKTKVYVIVLGRQLAQEHQKLIQKGVRLDDGQSKLAIRQLDQKGREWEVRMSEGRNRQIRRTFAALGYKVTSLHRTQFGAYLLNGLLTGQFVTNNKI